MLPTIIHQHQKLLSARRKHTTASAFLRFAREHLSVLLALLSFTLMYIASTSVHHPNTTATQSCSFNDPNDDDPLFPSAPSPQGQDIILTTYFTSSIDPQRHIKMRPNKYNYIRDWYQSVRHLNLTAHIFHDECSDDFTSAITRNSNGMVSFQRVSLQVSSPVLQTQRSTNDARFYHYRQYIIHNPHISMILMTDISDVTFQRNPFEGMRVLPKGTLFIGRDAEVFKSMGMMDWLVKRMAKCFPTPLPRQLDINDLPWVFNAGVIGGDRDVVMEFLEHVEHVLDMAEPKENCNMAAVNYVVHRYFMNRVFSGYPFTSLFRMYQHNPKGVFILHK